MKKENQALMKTNDKRRYNDKNQGETPNKISRK